MSANEDAILIGEIIRGYYINRSVSSNDFATVYNAHQQSIQREVAVKVIKPIYANDADFIRRFEAEAQTVARLEHMNIVPLYDYWRNPDGAYLIMRWMRGGSLRDVLDTNRILSPAQALKYINQVASALQVAHYDGIVHRDVKPENILLDEQGNAYLSDFGIATNIRQETETNASNLSFGSLEYLAPEHVNRASITPQADIYSMGILLYELLKGTVPFWSDSPNDIIQMHLDDPVPSLRNTFPDYPPELDMLIWRATAKSPYARHKNVREFTKEFELIVNNHQNIAETLPEIPNEAKKAPSAHISTVNIEQRRDTLSLAEAIPTRNPYRGLESFDEGDVEDFFGREDFVQATLDHLHTSNFLTIVGYSGSGKSSVIKAGLLPRLRMGRVPNSEHWLITQMTPDKSPFRNLHEMLVRIAANPIDTLLEDLQSPEFNWEETLYHLLPDAESDICLIIDHFEEIFIYVDDDVQEKFMTLLVSGLQIERFHLIISLRADFYGRPLLHKVFGSLLHPSMKVLLPPTASQFERIIHEPARKAGWQIETGLSAIIINDVIPQKGGLPLLQYVMTELVEESDGHLLTYETYEKIGGLSGALVKRANSIYEGLDSSLRNIVKRIFLRLIVLTRQATIVMAVRQRVSWSDLTSGLGDKEVIEDIIFEFAKYRLLTLDHDAVTREPTVEIAHEALIEQWQLLQEWIDDNHIQLQRWQQLVNATTEWIESTRDVGYLARGNRLLDFESLEDYPLVSLGEDEKNYLKASVKFREKTARWQVGSALVILGMLFVLMIQLITQTTQPVVLFSDDLKVNINQRLQQYSTIQAVEHRDMWEKKLNELSQQLETEFNYYLRATAVYEAKTLSDRD